MTLTIEEISDRIEIEDALKAYSTALDVPGRRWDLWYNAFTKDAVLEYPTLGPKSPAELEEIFKLNNATRLTTQHLILNVVIDVDGDSAKARSEIDYAAVNKGDTPEKNRLVRSGLWFDDTLQRTAEGWRITHRVAHPRWSETTEIAAA